MLNILFENLSVDVNFWCFKNYKLGRQSFPKIQIASNCRCTICICWLLSFIWHITCRSSCLFYRIYFLC